MSNSKISEQNSRLIPARLCAARKARDFKNSASFADYCGIARTTYRTHELGENLISAVDALRYAEALKISISWLLTGEGYPFDSKSNTSTEDEAKIKHHLRTIKVKLAMKEQERIALQKITDETEQKNN